MDEGSQRCGRAPRIGINPYAALIFSHQVILKGQVQVVVVVVISFKSGSIGTVGHAIKRNGLNYLEMECLHILHVQFDSCFAGGKVAVQLAAVVGDAIVFERQSWRYFAGC